MMIIQSLFEFLTFLLAIFTCFYLPGKFLINKLSLKLSTNEDIFFTTTLGLVFFTLISYLSAWFHIPILIVLMILIIDLIVVKQGKCLPLFFDQKDIKSLCFIISLSIVFSLLLILDGEFGERIILGPYAHDSLWHLSLINELKVNFPPDNPGFSGIPLKGYHFFYNLLLAKISNIFNLSPLSLYFHFFPPLIAFLWGLGVYVLMLKWTKDNLAGLWAVFLTFFGGSFGFILRLQGHQGLSLDDVFGMTQPASSLVNPPFSISIVILVAVLFALYEYLNSYNNKWLIPIILCVGCVSMFKVYAGIILIGGFIFLTLMHLIKKKFILFFASLGIGALFIFTYWVFADRSVFFIFYPLWAPHKVLEDNIKWYGYIEKQYTYSKLSVIRGLIKIELYGLYLFFLGNLGTRIIGLLILPILFFKRFKFPSMFVLTILAMTMISILIPLFFIQSIKVFEIIQMSWYFLFFCSLFSAFGLGYLFKQKYSILLKISVIIVFVIITLLSAYEKYEGYFRSHKRSLPKSYYEVTKFLSTQEAYNSTILEIPSEKTESTAEGLKTWYLKESTPKLLVFSNKRGYLNNEFIDFRGIDVPSRLNFIQKIIEYNVIFSTTSADLKISEDFTHKLKENKISFIYSPYRLIGLEKIPKIHLLYQNETETVYKIYE